MDFNGLKKSLKTEITFLCPSNRTQNFPTKFQRYSKKVKMPPKNVTFNQFWATIQRIQEKQVFDKLITDKNSSFSKQSYSLPSTIIDYLIKLCHTKCLFNLSQTCKELTYFIRKLRGSAIGYLILGNYFNGQKKADFGISTNVKKSGIEEELMLICNYESSKFLKNIVVNDVLEIYCPKNGDLIQEKEKLSAVLRIIKKLQHKKLIVSTFKGQMLTTNLNEFHFSKLFHENLTAIDMITTVIPLKYLPQLKSCNSIRFGINFKDSSNEKNDAIFETWKPQQKFVKFVIQIQTCFIPEIFINFITKSMASNSIFAINISEDFAFENHQIPIDIEDDEILHYIFCNKFGNLSRRNCFTTNFEINELNHPLSVLGYQSTFGFAHFCDDIFAPKNVIISKIIKWNNICNFSEIL